MRLLLSFSSLPLVSVLQLRNRLRLLAIFGAAFVFVLEFAFAPTALLVAQTLGAQPLRSAQTAMVSSKVNPNATGLLAGSSGSELVFEPVVVPLQNVEPFLALSASAMLRGADAQNVTVWIRISEEAISKTAGANADANADANAVQHWSEWIPANDDAHGSASGDEQESDGSAALTDRRWTSRLLFLGKETRAVQCKIQVRKTALYRSPSVSALTLHWCSPGATPQAELERMKNEAAGLARGFAVGSAASSVNLSQNTSMANIAKSSQQGLAQAGVPRPAFTSRVAWGCPTGETAGANQANLVSTDVTHLIVHHSFSPGNTVTDWPAAVRSVWNFHVNSNGWSDVGYNWLIDPNGVIYQGRAWVGANEDTQGAHFCGTNRNTIGVCMLGNYSEIPAPEAALQALVSILAYRASERNIDPLAQSFHANSGKTIFNISGHRDGVCATECPGALLYPVLPTIRERVAAVLKAASATSVRSANIAGFAIESVSPNPLDASAVVRFSIPTAGAVRLVVCNTLGQELRSVSIANANAGTQETTVLTADLPAGGYLLRVEFVTIAQTGAQAAVHSLTQSLRVVR